METEYTMGVPVSQRIYHGEDYTGSGEDASFVHRRIELYGRSYGVVKCAASNGAICSNCPIVKKVGGRFYMLAKRKKAVPSIPLRILEPQIKV